MACELIVLTNKASGRVFFLNTDCIETMQQIEGKPSPGTEIAFRHSDATVCVRESAVDIRDKILEIRRHNATK
jgi:uncharacterized protein YlzI (FlbEa/FlbD family)